MYHFVNLEIQLDLSCLTTDVFIEQFINTSDVTSMLYMWHNTTHQAWISGIDHCNIILISDPNKISTECKKNTHRYLEFIHVKNRYTTFESIEEKSAIPKSKNVSFHGIR